MDGTKATLARYLINKIKVNPASIFFFYPTNMKPYTVPVVHSPTIRWGEFSLTDEDVRSFTLLLHEECGTVSWTPDKIKAMAYDVIRIARVIVSVSEQQTPNTPAIK